MPDRSQELWLNHARTSQTPTDRTCRWPRPVIRIDPAVAFGRPMVAGAPVASVAGRILAGEPVAEVADDFGLNRRQALVACWWAGSQDDDFADWWARWADEAGSALATADDGDTVCEHIPDPPTIADCANEDGYRPVTTINVAGGLL